ncbi:zinc finger BED domain-containing protein 4-like [Periophthalmus magnuspinnatus]|uniref:zinc finger BED domain-containing protein 4-like n=1 Tax=Periophthalmus magnuspinnatus TaxID=409849 RepID=UPI0024367638|nr:zinc finger BED domain-containing protein 4-like [Periophthalmus magnuspinnatus]XP_055082261.1 zinc finger BED domain-containing protein 4-like [Periophthalmus magnuspinnatus]
MPKKLFNPLWLHFTEPIPGRGKCAHCEQTVSMGATAGRNKNTTNLWKHLENHHSEVFREAKRSKEELSRAADASTTQNIIAQIVPKEPRSDKWKDTELKSKKIDKLIAEMCATDEQPFTVVSGRGFKRLIAALEPKYTVKSERFYRSDLLENLYKKVQSCIRTLISPKGTKEPFLSFTADSSPGGAETMMSLTCHFIDDKWERRQLVLHVKAMTDASTVSYIHQFFLPLLKYWSINQTRVFLVLRDCGADVSEEQRLVEVPGLSCAAHSLQNVIVEGINSQQDVKDVIAKIRACARHFQHSILAKQRLKVIQVELNVPQNVMVLDDASRWISTLQMLRRTQEQKRSLTSYAQKYGHFAPPTNEEWELIKSIVETLSPFEEVSRDICTSASSLSCVIPSVSVLKMILQAECAASRGTATLRQTMLRGLERRFAKLEERKILVLATLLDPRYKCNVLSGDALNNAPKWLSEEHAACLALKEEEEEGGGGGGGGGEEAGSKQVCKQEEDEVRPGGAGLVEQIFASLLGQAPQEHRSPELSGQLEQYLNEPLIDRKFGDPLGWWRANTLRFDLLAPLARRLLSAPPASVPGQRSVDAREETRDGDENAEKLYFLKHNLPLIRWEY